MKAVLMSIQPKWCELIASGKKTVEVRKTKPKLQTPFKVYIYCTKDNTFAEKTLRGFDDGGKAIYYKANKGKVIGEFVCDRIDEFSVPYPAYFSEIDSKTDSIIKSACLKPMEIHAYNGVHQTYGWHITDLVIYDEPRELGEFYTQCREYCKTGTVETPKKCYKCKYQYTWNLASKCRVDGKLTIKRPFQSWGYVEEVE